MSYDPLEDAQTHDLAAEDVDLRRRLAREREESDFREHMSSERGRRMVWRQLERAGVFRLSHTADALQTAFNEGRRNEGLYVIGMIHALCPEKYVLMIQEQANDNDVSGRNDR